MTWPTNAGQESAEDVAIQATALVNRLRENVTSFRVLVASGGFNSLDVQTFYGLLAETVTYVDGKKNVTGLQAAIIRRYPGAQTFDPAVEWPAMKARIDPLTAWVRNNMEKSAGGRPTFQEYQDGTGPLVAFAITISGNPQTNLLGLIDALLARFS